MKKALIPFICTMLLPLLALAEDAYVAVDPATLNTVSGKTLMLVSYCVVLGMLLTYSIVLAVRTTQTSRQIAQLQNDKK